MKAKKEETPYKFWREYESLGMLKRGEKIKHIVEFIDSIYNLKNKKLRQHALATALQGYFDDLIDYMDASIEKKGSKNRNISTK